MRRIALALGIILVLTAFFVCCVGRVEKNTIDSRILFTVQETYTAEDTEPVIMLLMETEKVYGCCNYMIKDAVYIAGSEVRVDLQGIIEPYGCMTSLGPASSREPLVLADGSYELRFTKGLSASNYTLTVTPEKIEIEGADSDFVAPRVAVFWRYPRNSFAYLCGTTTDTAWIYDDFLDQLRAAVPLQEITFPDYGKTGYPRAPQGYWYNGPARYFVYESESDFDIAGDLLKTYSQQVLSQYTGVGIQLINWKGRSFRSWLMTGS